MIPVARTKNLLIHEVDNELIVYDQERNICHCLNAVAARVWHYCDGQHTVEDIAQFLKEEMEISADTDIRGLVWLTLDELESLHLMKPYLQELIVSTPTISRRKVIKRATLVGGFALGTLFPMVRSITSPALADMASGVNPKRVPPNPNSNSPSAGSSGIGGSSGTGGSSGIGSGLASGAGLATAGSGVAAPGVPKNCLVLVQENKCGKGTCLGTCQEIRVNGQLTGCNCVK